VGEAKLEHTLERIRHFAGLSGGEDIVIVFLLYPPTNTSFITAKQLTNGTTDVDGIAGTLAYSSLQAQLLNRDDVPQVPILLLSKLDGLSSLLKKHVASLDQQPPPQRHTATTFDLLKLCTASPAMSQQTALILSDLFADLRELAWTCTNVEPDPDSSPTSAQLTASQLMERSGLPDIFSSSVSSITPVSKLKSLRDLVGEKEYNAIIDFWQRDWAML
jgi:hypothetical protein